MALYVSTRWSSLAALVACSAHLQGSTRADFPGCAIAQKSAQHIAATFLSQAKGKITSRCEPPPWFGQDATCATGNHQLQEQEGKVRVGGSQGQVSASGDSHAKVQ